MAGRYGKPVVAPTAGADSPRVRDCPPGKTESTSLDAVPHRKTFVSAVFAEFRPATSVACGTRIVPDKAGTVPKLNAVGPDSTPVLFSRINSVQVIGLAAAAAYIHRKKGPEISAVWARDAFSVSSRLKAVAEVAIAF
jgi:hypothetical protein